MAKIERLSERSGVDTNELMENAGLAVAETCRRALGHDSRIPDIPVLMMIGPGNNGGDGLVAARHLSNWGARATVYLSASRREPHPKAAELPEPVRLVRSDDDADLSILRKSLSECELALDALLGTGSSRPISGRLSGQMAALAEARSERSDLLLVAVDLPTGVSADTGEADPMSVRSDITVALGLPKIGHCTMPGAELCGVVMIENIGLPARPRRRDRPVAHHARMGQVTPARSSGGWSQGHFRQGAGRSRMPQLRRRRSPGICGRIPRRRRTGYGRRAERHSNGRSSRGSPGDLLALARDRRRGYSG